MREHDIDATLEIEISGFGQSGVNVKLRLYRKRMDGFREDALSAIFGGVLLKEHDYSNLAVGSKIIYQGIKAPVRIVDDDDEKASDKIKEAYENDIVGKDPEKG